MRRAAHSDHFLGRLLFCAWRGRAQVVVIGFYILHFHRFILDLDPSLAIASGAWASVPRVRIIAAIAAYQLSPLAAAR